MIISLVQMLTKSTPQENLIKIKSLVKSASAQGAELVVLPEMCCCAYENKAFVKHAMSCDSDFIKELSNIAKDNSVVLVAGTVPERDNEKIYNTSFVFNEQGELIAKHRKAHLFDIDIKGGVYFKESDTFSAGSDFTTFDTKWGKMGLMICFDIRFPEFIKEHAKDINLVIVPASFNMSTGPKHWELLFRARAVDNQVYMAGCASARDENASYHSWGHSILTDPWGDVIAQLDEKEGILTTDIDFDLVKNVRAQLPLLSKGNTD